MLKSKWVLISSSGTGHPFILSLSPTGTPSKTSNCADSHRSYTKNSALTTYFCLSFFFLSNCGILLNLFLFSSFSLKYILIKWSLFFQIHEKCNNLMKQAKNFFEIKNHLKLLEFKIKFKKIFKAIFNIFVCSNYFKKVQNIFFI